MVFVDCRRVIIVRTAIPFADKWRYNGVDYSDKSSFNWISVIRLPDFISKDYFEWAIETATKKKKIDCSCAEFLTITEGLCVQMMHNGPYDEPATVGMMDRYLEDNGYHRCFSVFVYLLQKGFWFAACAGTSAPSVCSVLCHVSVPLKWGIIPPLNFSFFA